MACGWLSEYTSFLDARPGEHGPHAVLAQPLDPTTFYGLRGKHSSETLLGSCKGEWVFMGEEPRLFVVRTDQTASDLHGKKKKKALTMAVDFRHVCTRSRLNKARASSMACRICPWPRVISRLPALQLPEFDGVNRCGGHY